jgi:hypothetical protein
MAAIKKQSATANPNSGNQKFSLHFLKEKKMLLQNINVTVYLLVEVIYFNKSLEAVKINLLSKDPQIINEKQIDRFEDAILDEFKIALEKKLEKFNELMKLYLLNLESIKSCIESCIAKKLTQIPYKFRIQNIIVEQQQLHSMRQKEEQTENEIFRDYIIKLINKEDKRKSDKPRKMKFDLFSMTHPIESFDLDFLADQLYRQDFYNAYHSLLLEYSDFNCTVKQFPNSPHIDKNTTFYSKFIKEHLMIIMNIK